LFFFFFSSFLSVACRPWWFFAVMFFLSFLHLSFNANPMHTSASLAKREAEKAAEKAKKAK